MVINYGKKRERIERLTIGHWANHKYIRRGVEKDVKEFCGWNKILSLMNQAETIGKEIIIYAHIQAPVKKK